MQKLQLKKGDIFLKEGDASTSMYWIQSGSIRLYKKKGDGFVELGVLHQGEVVGELAFFDQLPRSANAEALQACELIEIPHGNFEKFLAEQPSWLKSLISTLVKRVRASSNRIRELESNSMSFKTDKSGDSHRDHEFLQAREIYRLCAMLLLAASRKGKGQTGEIRIRSAYWQALAVNLQGIHLSKVTYFMGVLSEAGIVGIEGTGDAAEIILRDSDMVERYMYWLQDDSQKRPEQQIRFSDKAMALVEAIWEHSDLASVLGDQEVHPVEIDHVSKAADQKSGKAKCLEWSALSELVGLGLAKNIMVGTGGKSFTDVPVKKFRSMYPMAMLNQRFIRLNAQKRDV